MEEAKRIGRECRMDRNPGADYNNGGNDNGPDDGQNDDNQDDNDYSSDDSFWFSKSFKYKSFDFDMDGMASEESFPNGSNCLVDVDEGPIDSLESEQLADGVLDDAIENIFLQQCQENVSQQTEESADASENEDSNNRQTKQIRRYLCQL